METLRVIATLVARPGREKDLRELLLGLIPPTRAEQGCLHYELHENLEIPGEFTFVEEWTDPAALDAHFQTPHMKRAGERSGELLARELELRKCRLLG